MQNFITHKPIDDISGTVSSEFGKRFPPKTGASTQHKGIDFSISINTPVYAAHPAEVIYKAYNGGWGNFILLRDTVTGAGTLYGHFSKYSKIADSDGNFREIEVGDIIAGGTQIGLSGNSGISSGAHLHLEIFDSEAINKIILENRSPDKDDIRQNPREHLAQAFPYEFATTVKSGNYGTELTGDFRPNTFIDNPRANTITGRAGYDTYRLKISTGVTDKIIDVDNEGKLEIDGVDLSGTANAVKKPSSSSDVKEWYKTRWTLNGYELTRVDDLGNESESGNNLAISKARDGAKSIASRGKVIVQSYPFNAQNQIPAFGINLGQQKQSGNNAPTYHALEDGYLPVTSSSAAQSSSPIQLFPTTSNKEFFTLGSSYSANGKLAIQKFNAKGEVVSSQVIADYSATDVLDGDGTKIGSATNRFYLAYPNANPNFYKLNNGNVVFIYGVGSTALYDNSATPISGSQKACRVVIDSNGDLVSHEIIEQRDFSRSELTSNPDSFDRAAYLPTLLTDKGMCFAVGNDFKCGTLADNSLPVTTDNTAPYNSATQDHRTLTLLYGHKIGSSVYYEDSTQKLGVSVAEPIYKEIPDAQKVENTQVSGGTFIADSTLSKQIFSMQEGTSANLDIASAAQSSRLMVYGLDSNDISDARITLPSLDAEIHQVSSAQYSTDDLLNGNFAPSSTTFVRTLPSKARRILQSTGSANSTDDTASYYYSEEGDDNTLDEEDANLDLTTPITALYFRQNNQTVFLDSVNATAFIKSPQNYYSFSELASPSQSPVPNPTRKPTTQPISFMTNFLLPVPKGSAISSEFGDTQGDSLNNGITFAVAENTSINAIASGTVIRTITNHPELGNVVAVRHDDGQTGSLYAHLNLIDVAVGSVVTDTTPVGLSGLTNAGNARLHLEVINGAAFLDVIEAASGTDIGSDYELSLINPRPLFNTRYTEAEFTRTVVADAAEITADSRDNKAKSTNSASDTILYGNAGNDKYFFDFTKDGGYLATHYTISDTDLDGAIEVAYGDGSYVTLEGNARAKTDADGNIIANNWVFPQGFEAKLDGSNLVIFKAGADITNDSVGRIIIENYSGPRSFGFTLGKTTDLTTDGTSTTGYDSKTVTLTENRLFNGGPFLQTEDGFSGILRRSTVSGDRYVIGKFASNGVLTEEIALSDEYEATSAAAPVSYIDPTTGELFLATTFSSLYTDASGVRQSRIGLCIIDNNGNRVSSKTVDSLSGASTVSSAIFFQQPGTADDDFSNPGDLQDCFYISYNQAGSRKLRQVDMTTYENVGTLKSISSSTGIGWVASNSLQFSDGNKLSIGSGSSLSAQLPKLRDQVGTEIVPNYTPDSSEYVTSSTVAKSIISVNPNQALDLVIASNPNSVTVLMADSAFANIDSGTGPNITFSLPVTNLSQASVYSTSSSLEEILSGTIVPSSRRALTSEEETAALVSNDNPELVAKIWRKNLRGSADMEIVDPLKASLPEDIFGKPEKRYLRFDTESAIGDDFLTTDDITLNEVTQPITIIELLDGQKVVLVGKNATEVKQSLSTYFSTQDLTPTAAPSYFLTFVPTGNPTTLVPTLLPTVDPTTNQPTKNPTFVPSKDPTSGPSWVPSEEPSSEPTYTPSIDPSGNPTMVPTISPTGKPTEIPTFSPSYSPSSVPSLNPSFVPTESPTPAPSGVPSKMPTLSPTLSPTNEPSLVPTLSPTGEPTELPSYIPTYDPTRIPTIQLTRAPTNLPSNFPTVTPTINPTTLEPTLVPSFGPTQSPSDLPTIEPSLSPTGAPTVIPSESPTALPSEMPTFAPTMIPSDPPTSPPTLVPSLLPTTDPTKKPTRFPTFVPTVVPSEDPTQAPTVVMTEAPTDHPSDSPSWFPTFGPTGAPITWMPTTGPSVSPTDLPSVTPSSDPTKAPTITPSVNPSSRPSSVPTRMPSFIPSARPSVGPSGQPTLEPTLIPTGGPTSQPSGLPTEMPVFTWDPTGQPSYKPVTEPSSIPSGTPTFYPTFDPTVKPTVITFLPTGTPTKYPTITPSSNPTSRPTFRPSPKPTLMPSYQPTMAPSNPPTIPPSHVPSVRPTVKPTVPPTLEPTFIPTPNPTGQPSVIWTKTPTGWPSGAPTWKPSSNPTTGQPTMVPTNGTTYDPSAEPSVCPSSDPSKAPTFSPSRIPSRAPTTYVPTYAPTNGTLTPTLVPSSSPSQIPTFTRTINPTTGQPTYTLTDGPTTEPTFTPTFDPTKGPTKIPTFVPTAKVTHYNISSSPSGHPSVSPTIAPSVKLQESRMPSSRPSDKKEPTSWPSRTPITVPSERPSIAPSFKAIGGGNNESLSAGAWGGIAAALTVAIGGIGLWWRNRNQRQAEARIVHDPMDNRGNMRDKDGDDNLEIVISQKTVARNKKAASEENLSDEDLDLSEEEIDSGEEEIDLGEEEIDLSEEEIDLGNPLAPAKLATTADDQRVTDNTPTLSAEKNSPNPVIKPIRKEMKAPTGPSIHDLPESLRKGVIGGDGNKRQSTHGVHLDPLPLGQKSSGGGGRGSDGARSGRNKQKVIPVTTIPDGMDGHK